MSDEDADAAAAQKVIQDSDVDGETKTPEEREKQKAFDSYAHSKKQEGVNMTVKVYSPSRVYFDDVAFSVTATNDTGEFDILPKHHNFICLLSACNLVIRTAHDGNRTLAISGGMMHVKADQIIVFLDI